MIHLAISYSRQEALKMFIHIPGENGIRKLVCIITEQDTTNSTLGRFINGDPIGFAGGDVNFYVYVQNNPVNFIDPDGLEIFIVTEIPPATRPFIRLPKELAEITKNAQDVIDTMNAAQDAFEGCPTPIEKKVRELADDVRDKNLKGDMRSGDNSQVKATPKNGVYANQQEFWVGGVGGN